jgi:hypothetical protein
MTGIYNHFLSTCELSLPGALAPVGFFDPLGVSTEKQEEKVVKKWNGRFQSDCDCR